jgi:hypothetical protein
VAGLQNEVVSATGMLGFNRLEHGLGNTCQVGEFLLMAVFESRLMFFRDYGNRIREPGCKGTDSYEVIRLSHDSIT